MYQCEDASPPSIDAHDLGTDMPGFTCTPDDVLFLTGVQTAGYSGALLAAHVSSACVTDPDDTTPSNNNMTLINLPSTDAPVVTGGKAGLTVTVLTHSNHVHYLLINDCLAYYIPYSALQSDSLFTQLGYGTHAGFLTADGSFSTTLDCVNAPPPPPTGRRLKRVTSRRLAEEGAPLERAARQARKLNDGQVAACDTLRTTFGVDEDDCFMSYYDLGRHNEADYTRDQRRAPNDTATGRWLGSYTCVLVTYLSPPPPPELYWTINAVVTALASAITNDASVPEGALRDAVETAVHAVAPDALVGLVATEVLADGGRRLGAQDCFLLLDDGSQPCPDTGAVTSSAQCQDAFTFFDGQGVDLSPSNNGGISTMNQWEWPSYCVWFGPESGQALSYPGKTQIFWNPLNGAFLDPNDSLGPYKRVCHCEAVNAYACASPHCNEAACATNPKTRLVYRIAIVSSAGVDAAQRAQVLSAIKSALAQFKSALGADALCGVGDDGAWEAQAIALAPSPPPSPVSPPSPPTPPSPPPPSPPPPLPPAAPWQQTLPSFPGYPQFSIVHATETCASPERPVADETECEQFYDYLTVAVAVPNTMWSFMWIGTFDFIHSPGCAFTRNPLPDTGHQVFWNPNTAAVPYAGPATDLWWLACAPDWPSPPPSPPPPPSLPPPPPPPSPPTPPSPPPSPPSPPLPPAAPWHQTLPSFPGYPQFSIVHATETCASPERPVADETECEQFYDYLAVAVAVPNTMWSFMWIGTLDFDLTHSPGCGFSRNPLPSTGHQVFWNANTAAVPYAGPATDLWWLACAPE